MFDKAITFGEAAGGLVAHGWRPVPLNPGTKAPVLTGWPTLNHEQWDDFVMEDAVMRFSTAAVGLVMQPEIVAIDIDVMDEALNTEVVNLLVHHAGDTPLARCGQAPKMLGIWRSDGSVVSRKPHPIEIFSGSGQVAAYGWHQKANRPYYWMDRHPLDMAVGDPAIPTISQHQIDQWLADCAPLFRELSHTKGSNRTTQASYGSDHSTQMLDLLRCRVSFTQAARMVLSSVNPDVAGEGRHSAVMAVVSAGINRRMDPDRLEQIISNVSPELYEVVTSDGWLDRLFTKFTQKQEPATWLKN